MKSFLTFLCAAVLASASLAAQSAPAGDTQRVVAELLRMAQERNAAGDAHMARALTEQASRMMGGQPAADAATPVLMALGGVTQPMQLDQVALADAERQGLTLNLQPRQAFLELAELERGALFTPGEMSGLTELSGLGYLGSGDVSFTGVHGTGTQEPGQDHLHASLMAIREELGALRAEVSALRAEIAAQRSGNMFWGGNVIPTLDGVMAPGVYQLQAPGQQGQFYHLPQGGGPAAPAGAPQSVWQRYDSVPVQPSGAPSTGPAAPGGGAGAWQRHHAQAEAEAAAAARARDAYAAAMQQAHAAWSQAPQGAAAGAFTPPPGPPGAAVPPAPPAAPAAPSTPRSSSRPHDVR